MLNAHVRMHPIRGLIGSRDSHNEFLYINFGSLLEQSFSDVLWCEVHVRFIFEII